MLKDAYFVFGLYTPSILINRLISSYECSELTCNIGYDFFILSRLCQFYFTALWLEDFPLVDTTVKEALSTEN